MKQKRIYEAPEIDCIVVRSEGPLCASINGMGIGNASESDLTGSSWGGAL